MNPRPLREDELPAAADLAARAFEQPARSLLWAALAEADGVVRLSWITGNQDWAIAIALRAGLELSFFGAVCVRGAPGPWWPYLPSGAYC